MQSLDRDKGLKHHEQSLEELESSEFVLPTWKHLALYNLHNTWKAWF